MAESRKRERKTVERFKPDAGKETTRTVVAEGKGSKLGDIPNVCFKLDKMKGTDEALEQLHQLLFKSKGKALSRKKDIKSFSGFVHDGDQTEEAKKVEGRVSKLTLPQIHTIMDLLDVPRGSDAKEKKIEKIVEFLEKPEVLSEKDLKAQAETKKTKAAAKRAKASAKKDKAATTKPSSAKKAEKSVTKGVTKKKGTPVKKATPARKGASKEETPAKKASAKKDTKAATSARKRKADAAEPTAKKAKKAKTESKGWPSDGKIEKDVEEIVEEMTGGDGTIKVKAVYEAVGKRYGLSKEEVQSKKADIRAILKKLHQASIAQDAEEPVNEEAVAAEHETVDTEMEAVDEVAPSEPPAQAPEPTENAPEPAEAAPEEAAVEPKAASEIGQLEPTPNLEISQQPAPSTQQEVASEPEVQEQPTVWEPATDVESPSHNVAPGKTILEGEEVTGEEASQIPQSVAQPIVHEEYGTQPSAYHQQDEPAAEDPPLIQEPATMEGDELPESSFDKRAYNPNIQEQPSQPESFDPTSFLNL